MSALRASSFCDDKNTHKKNMQVAAPTATPQYIYTLPLLAEDPLKKLMAYWWVNNRVYNYSDMGKEETTTH